MSVVYRAVDQTLGRPVALKLIQQPSGSDHLRDDLRLRFRREAGSAARISPHPNVVRIYDYGTDLELDLDFIVMELLAGRDLADLLRHKPPAQPVAVRILLQAALGIAAGHRAGILHRDIKPGNIFLVEGDGDGVRVLDFGIAKVLEAEGEEDLTLLGLPPHSPAYSSPEQLDPTCRLTPASDVYQLGLVGYEILSGTKPYTPAERDVLLRGEPVPLPTRGRWSVVPAPLGAVVERALSRNPLERYSDAATFADALASAAEEVGVSTDTLPSLPPSRVDLTGYAREVDDRTLAAEPSGPSGEDTLFADHPSVPGAEGGLDAGDGTLFAPDHPSYGAAGDPDAAELIDAPKRELPQPRRRRIGVRQAWRAAGVALVLGGVALGAVELLKSEESVREIPYPELEETFRELQSEASNELERAGLWER
jgi:serine/threonine protein kinase